MPTNHHRLCVIVTAHVHTAENVSHHLYKHWKVKICPDLLYFISRVHATCFLKILYYTVHFLHSFWLSLSMRSSGSSTAGAGGEITCTHHWCLADILIRVNCDKWADRDQVSLPRTFYQSYWWDWIRNLLFVGQSVPEYTVHSSFAVFLIRHYCKTMRDVCIWVLSWVSNN